jgi:hypothetical protein
MNKKILCISLFAIVGLTSQAFAFVSNSSLLSMTLPVYAIYTTADPTCQTGLVTTVPFTSSPTNFNFVAGGPLGVGGISSSVNCAVFIIQNSLTAKIAPGSYSSTSLNGGGQTYSDSVCGSTSGLTLQQMICSSTSMSALPTQISTDAAKAGVTIATTSCGNSLSEVVPLVLSTYSSSTGRGGSSNAFSFPTGAADALHGLLLTSPSVQGNLRFVVNPTNTYGGGVQNNGPLTCNSVFPPAFSFVQN